MKCRLRVGLYLIASVVMLSSGCSSIEPKYKVPIDVPLQSESDSLSYIIGMNVARELYKMDSLLDVNVVCRAIIEHSQGKLLMSDDEARTQYLRYLLHVEPERQRAIEERFLADLALADRNFTRTKSGLTYNIEVIGDEKLTPKASGDWVTISYYISVVGDEVIYPKQGIEQDIEQDSEQDSEQDFESNDIERVEESMALSDLPSGLEEALKLIGKGGRIKVWLPSKLGYREEGDVERGIQPTQTTYFDIELVEMERNGAAEHKALEF